MTSEKDLALACEVQRGFLPASVPTVSGYEFFQFFQPADRLGGDYYDYVRISDLNWGIFIGEAVGSGIAKAMLLAALSGSINARASIEKSPADLLSFLNSNLHQRLNNRFVTAIAAFLDPVQHTVTIANAGHTEPLLRRTNGEVVDVGSDNVGIPLGVTDEYSYEDTIIELEAGEFIGFLTDGVIEAISPNQNEDVLPIDRVRRYFREENTIRETGQAMVKSLSSLSANAQQDDMCIVGFGRILP